MLISPALIPGAIELGILLILLVGGVTVAVLANRSRSPRKGRQSQAPAKNAVGADAGSAWATTLATPTLLVPTLIAGLLVCITCNVDGWGQWVSDNPFGLEKQSNGETNTWMLLAMSVTLAGYVGLLTAYHHSGKANSGHFLAGIKDHTITFLLAKLAIAGWASFVSAGLGVDEPVFAVLYLAPSLLLAPLLGTAALHPRQPLRALGAALDRRWDLPHTSRLVLFQAIALIILWELFSFFNLSGTRFSDSVILLAQDTSALSFNAFPMMPLSGVSMSSLDILEGTLCTALAMILSTAFMHAHFRRVLQQPRR